MTVNWLICREPVHIGGADSSNRGNNNPIFRVSDRTPAIPGSALRGALREEAEKKDKYKDKVKDWFGGKDDSISPGYISLGWGWPVWWPVHVLGYGNWWVSCPAWLNRFQQLSSAAPLPLDGQQIYSTDRSFQNQSVFLRWLKLTNVQHWNQALPAPSEVPGERRIIVPDESINLLVDMGLIRQPRVSLLDEPVNGNLVQNLFAVEGIPPGAIFLFTAHPKPEAQHLSEWETFLSGEHYIGGLWGVGYGRVEIMKA